MERIAELQARLYAEESRGVLVVLQGIDAAGKDSTVKHVFSGSNPQGVRVYSFKEPTAEEAAHDFLWRYHHDCPALGMIHVFNRSHYEDVLVVRVKELVEEARWRSRYDSINDFERMLARERIVIVKFFLQHLQGRAARALPRAAGARGQALQVLGQRRARAAQLGRLPGGLPRRGDADLDAVGAVVRGPGRPQVVPEPAWWRGSCARRSRRWTRAGRRPDPELEDYALEELEESTSSKR